METKLISVRMPTQLITQMQVLADSEGYASLQEIIKESVRVHLNNRKMLQAKMQMKQLAGSQKLKRPLTRNFRNQIAKEFLKNKK